jgi:hypothetical protein
LIAVAFASKENVSAMAVDKAILDKRDFRNRMIRHGKLLIP